MATTTESANIDFALSTGTLQKPIYEMTSQEREAFYKDMRVEARSYLFSIGQPWVYENNGSILAEYADGTLKVIR